VYVAVRLVYPSADAAACGAARRLILDFTDAEKCPTSVVSGAASAFAAELKARATSAKATSLAKTLFVADHSMAQHLNPAAVGVIYLPAASGPPSVTLRLTLSIQTSDAAALAKMGSVLAAANSAVAVSSSAIALREEGLRVADLSYPEYVPSPASYYTKRSPPPFASSPPPPFAYNLTVEKVDDGTAERLNVVGAAVLGSCLAVLVIVFCAAATWHANFRFRGDQKAAALERAVSTALTHSSSMISDSSIAPFSPAVGNAGGGGNNKVVPEPSPKI